MGSRRIQLLRVALRVSLAAILLGTAFAQPLSAHGLGPSGVAVALPVGAPAALADDDGSGPVSTVVLAPSVSPATLRDPSGVLPGLPWEASGGLSISTDATPWRVLLIDGAPAPEDLFIGGDSAPAPCAPQQPCPVTFWCPGLDGTPALNEGTNTMTIRSTCPYRIADDADLLGSPQIAVNPDDPNSMAFFSLHGGGSTEGPTPRSRDPSPEGLTSVTGLSHTTFTSQDHGRSWHDNPWGTDGFGEHAAGTMDNDGNLYISALWSKRLGEGRFNYVIKLYKEQDGRYTIATYQPSKTFSNRADGNTISDANIVFLSAPRVEPLNVTGNETQNATAPAGQGDVGNYTSGESYGTNNSAEDRVMAVWFEKALDWRNSTTGKSSWIDAAWTDTTPKDNWTRLADDELIGPCMAASNPVAFDGKAYVACVADAGYQGRSRAHVGDIDVWSIDPKTGKTTLEENTRLVGGQPHMASRPDGYMAVATVAVLDERNIDAQVAFGWYGQHWSDRQNAGSQLHTLMGGHKVREARVTSMALTQEKNSLFLTYMERINTEGEVPEPNPSTLNTDPNQVIEYRKLVTTFSQCFSGAMDAYDLQTGVARHPFNEEVIGDAANATGVFDDLQDGMQFWRDPDSGEERVYFAYGDHGVIQFGALVGGGSSPACALTAPPPALPPPPVPAALSTASPYTVMVGSTVGATALAMVTYLLAAKKRTLTFSAAKDKRK